FPLLPAMGTAHKLALGFQRLNVAITGLPDPQGGPGCIERSTRCVEIAIHQSLGNSCPGFWLCQQPFESLGLVPLRQREFDFELSSHEVLRGKVGALKYKSR